MPGVLLQPRKDNAPLPGTTSPKSADKMTIRQQRPGLTLLRVAMRCGREDAVGPLTSLPCSGAEYQPGAHRRTRSHQKLKHCDFAGLFRHLYRVVISGSAAIARFEAIMSNR